MTVNLPERLGSWEVHLWPAVPLDLVLVVCVSSLQQRLLCAAPACNLADHCTACAGDDLHSTERVVSMCLGPLKVGGNPHELVKDLFCRDVERMTFFAPDGSLMRLMPASGLCDTTMA